MLAAVIVAVSRPSVSSRIALAVVGYAISQWRARAARQGYQQAVESVPMFALKILAIGAVVMWFAYQLASSRGLPSASRT